MNTQSTPGWFCDWNAGAPVLPDVLQCFLDVERSCSANPASAHAPGRRARGVLEAARSRIAQALGVLAEDVVFTSGGTEAANLAVRGLGDPNLPVLLSPAEHPAVFEPALVRGTRPWAVDASGAALVADPETAVGLICLVHSQSELGTLQPVRSALGLADSLRVPLLVDAAQTLGREDLQPLVALGATLVLSPHKAGGLRGHGALVGRGLHGRLRPLLRGGAQELGLRPGTQSPALAMANALAIELAIAQRPRRAARMRAVRAAFLDGLRRTAATHVVLTPLADSATVGVDSATVGVAQSVPNTAMIHFAGVDGRNLLPALDLAGVHASHGSACSSGAPTPPRILSALGLDDAQARACVRFSCGGDEDLAAIERAGRCVGDVVQQLAKRK